MSEATKPIPAPTDNTAPFWSGCAAGELRLRKCAACGVFRSPTRMVCACGATAAEWTAVSGRGTVFSYTVVHRAPDPAFKAELPYVIAIVALDEGGRLMSNLVGTEPDSVRIGMPVQAMFETVAEGIGVPKFRAAQA
ncbi:MAG: Zn-ribbon domain-containing OB-fold protein [Rhodocyclaceae bacterium]|jgi:uncharacterized OB-fold protein|nr:Zn-ribbon domain-containing OB-fold protein [Rhodocyclaceae bacterium]MCA3076218.1 Zn-ribbon domain-containing OB-fold protein [Rhodocyclaceae bacterium]MCA3100086.1 Zn-ribbon domain-containing OB-fold protein [Rhodocyclaceae bacterium]MCA3100978.1 Zn-ribbon domain-containing OB-fold protein [Rhodocyclaceae bacterium]MCA3109813.1 Zn-ribbon domain-containing OB-fold protein [Rhodocyclaceae bacterium]